MSAVADALMYHGLPSYTMQTVTAKLTPALVEFLDAAIAQGWFANRSEAVRAAVRELAQREYLQRVETGMIADIDWALSADA